MHTSSLVIDKARQLSAAGHHAEVVEYLGSRAGGELEQSPSLALLYGTAQARLGHHDEGKRWLDLALDQARERDEQAVERHALNARGALALISGRIDEAADYFTRALMAASRDGDLATTARCSNNLGIISSMRGRHAEAIGSWEIALAAYGNLAISYREQGAFDRALAEADQAVAQAEAAGDRTLWAMVLRGRAEIRVARGELGLAQRDLDLVREIRARLPNPAGEGEDLRVAASVLAAEGQLVAAERALREAIRRGEAYQLPLLEAEAQRDLCLVLRRGERHADAQAAARAAKALFQQLGAEREIRNLAGQDWGDEFAAELRGSLAPLHAAQELADAGRYADLMSYLGERAQNEVEQSPMLALLSSIGHARMGRLDLGQQWSQVALSRSRVLGDRRLELRALNVCGAIALERGGINEATHFFTRAQEEAMQDNDMATLGKCANNLGIIANMQGDYGRAVGSYTRAIAAYQAARSEQGIAEAQHNLAIAYRELGHLDDAMQSADAAVREAERLGDRRLRAQALAGRAEIRAVRGEPELAVREAGRALAVHRELQDPVLETEDMRILAVALGMTGKTEEAAAMFRDVVNRATEHGRPLLVAVAQRDLAYLLAREGEFAAAQEAAHAARATFHRLGARADVEKLEALLAHPEFGAPELASPRPETPVTDAGPEAGLPPEDLPIQKRESLDR